MDAASDQASESRIFANTHHATRFLYGALTWLIPAALGLTAALLFDWVDVQINSSVDETIGAALLRIVLVLVYEAFPKELIFRGYIYRNLTDRIAPWVAVVIQALLFCVFGICPA